MEWFESQGVALKCEDDLRVFPISNNGQEVISAFEGLFEKYAGFCTVHTSTTLDAIEKQNHQFQLHYQENSLLVDILVITTGGNAYAHTGSTGDGYHFAQRLGHTITPLGPSLSSFEVLEAFPKEISGISLPKVRLRWGNEVITEGPLLFSHFGIT